MSGAGEIREKEGNGSSSYTSCSGTAVSCASATTTFPSHLGSQPSSSSSSSEERAHAALQAQFGITLEALPLPSLHVGVAIAGGGLGGLALAVGLQRPDSEGGSVSAHVFEAAPALRTDSGTIFGATKHCFAALDGLQPGLSREIRAAGCTIAGSRHFFKEVGTDPLAPAVESFKPPRGNDLTVIPWKEAQRILASRMRPDSVHCSHRLVTYLPVREGGGVDVVFARRKGRPCVADVGVTSLTASMCNTVITPGTKAQENSGKVGGSGQTAEEDKYGEGESDVAVDPMARASERRVQEKAEEVEVVVVRAQMLVGADGLRSAVRATMVGDEPRYVRCIDWNALVPHIGDGRHEGNGPAAIAVPQTICAGFDRPAKINWLLVDAGHGLTYWGLRIFDTELKLTPTLGPFGGFGRKGGKKRMLHMFDELLEKARRGTGEDFTASPSSLHGADSVQKLDMPETGLVNGSSSKEGHGNCQGKEEGAGERWEMLRRALEATEEPLIFERLMYDRLPLPSWSDLGGRVVILGDAAHAMFPGPGQGAQTAFEDAHQLCESLRKHHPAAAAAMAYATPQQLLLDGTKGMEVACGGGPVQGTAVGPLCQGKQGGDDASFLLLQQASAEAISAAVLRYESLRVKRCNRVQAAAAEMTALPPEMTKTKEVLSLTPEQAMKRGLEFALWLDKYPDCIDGDPDSTYWKP